MLVRNALANSYNIPAVKTMQFVGIKDDPGTCAGRRFHRIRQTDGYHHPHPPFYGLALTLGAAGDSPAGNDLGLLPFLPTAVVSARQLRSRGSKITPAMRFPNTAAPPASRCVRPEHAYLISSILSDNEARTPVFGGNSVLNMPFEAAVKTGTTNDFRDNWTLGYTPDLAVGVWVGNADYSPMIDSTGLTGAAPIWSQFMQTAEMLISNNNPTSFSRPANVVDVTVCSASGTKPSDQCPTTKSEIFAFDQPPLGMDQDLWKRVRIDTWTGLLASSVCGDFVKDKDTLNVSDKSARKWILDSTDGQNWAAEMGFEDPISFTPSRECREEDSRVVLVFVNPTEGQTVATSPLDIVAVIKATSNFKEWRLDYGLGDKPKKWIALVSSSKEQHPNPDVIYSWALKDISTGKISLRLTIYNKEGGKVEKKVTFNNQVPTPTPTPTSSPTATLSPTVTPTATLTPEPTLPEPSSTP